jgi:hypothetical protein
MHGRAKCLAVVLLLSAGCIASTARADSPRAIPASYRETALGLLGPHGRGAPLPGGFAMRDVRIDAAGIRWRFARGDAVIEVDLVEPSQGRAAVGRNFALVVSDPGAALDQSGREDLRAYLAGVLAANDTGPSPWVAADPDAERREALEWLSERGASFIWKPDFDYRLYRQPAMQLATRLCQAEIVLGLLLLAWRWRRVRDRFAAVPRGDVLFILACTAAGVALRTAWGIRVPAEINHHGWEHLFAILHQPPAFINYHGNGSFALTGLAFTLLPRTELSVVVANATLSVLTIPVMAALATEWIGNRGAGRWAAAITALLPAFVFYGSTEERCVAGVFFMALTLLALRSAARRDDPVLMAASALLGAAACQFQPFFFLLPAPAAMLLLATPDGRRLAGRWWAWAAAAACAAALAPTLRVHLGHLVPGTEGPASDLTTGILGWRTFAGVFMPSANADLDPAYTPPTLAVLAAAGAVALWRSGRRAVAGGLVASYVLLFVPGMAGMDRMNLVRLELPAQPFLVLLAAAGLAALAGAMRGRLRLPPWSGQVAAAAVLVGSVVAWPGPIPKLFAPQREDRFLAAAIPDLGESRVIAVAGTPGLRSPTLPGYLSAEAGRNDAWVVAPDPSILPGMPGRQPLYYRPVDCFDYRWERGPGASPAATGLRPECARFEAGLDLRPVLTAVVPVEADCVQEFRDGEVEIGFFEPGPAARGSP